MATHAIATASFSPEPCQHLLLEKSNATEIIKHEDKFIFYETLQLFKG